MAQDSYVSPALLTSGATWAQLQANGLNGMVALLIAANPAIANPTVQATVAVTGGGASGGALPAGTYYSSYVWRDGIGRTMIGSSRSNSFTSASGNKPRVTVPAVPSGACCADLYLTVAGGAAGTETLYITGVTTTTVDLLYAAPTDPGIAIPAANTTGAAAMQGRLQQPLAGLLQLQWQRFTGLVDNFLSGCPVDFQSTRDSLWHLGYCEAFYQQLATDINTLIAANHGTIGTVIGNVIARPVRTWP